MLILSPVTPRARAGAWTDLCTRRRHAYYFFFLMIRRPPRSTLDRSSAASDVYKRQLGYFEGTSEQTEYFRKSLQKEEGISQDYKNSISVSYTHLRAHETVLDLVCRLLLEKRRSTARNTD